MALTPDVDRLRDAFIQSRLAVVDQAETVAHGRANGTLSAAALDRLVEEVDALQRARRAFIVERG